MVVHWLAVLRCRLLTGLAGRLRHPGAAVRLAAHHRALGLHYHGLGGDPDRGVAEEAGPGGVRAGGTHRGNDLLAWLDRDQMHLPRRIDRFPDPALNRELYFWLAAFFALDRALDGEDALPAGLQHLFRGIATSTRVLERYPALAPRYRRLCAEELAQRRDAMPALGDDAGRPVHQIEAGIRHVLGAARPPDDPWLLTSIGQARRGTCPAAPPARWRRLPLPFLPVFLWGCPRSEASGLRLRWLKRRTRRRAQGSIRALADPRFEPRLPGGSPADAQARGGALYPEWDWRRGAYRARWCRVTEQAPHPAAHADLGPDVAVLVRRVRRRFEALREVRAWTRGLENGDELDLEAFVDAAAERRNHGRRSTRLYRRREAGRRDLAVAVLLDMSRSTAAWVGEHRVIEVARQSMAVLAEALAATGDEFALYGFASDSRHRVRCHRLKGFGERYEDGVRRRLQALEPGDYTRMGAAVRHAGRGLCERPRARKLMLVITDGRPHDPTDGYQGRYALEDTRRALLELRVRGAHCVGLTVDRRGRSWLPYLFGPGHYAVFSRPEALPAVLPRLYARITGLEG